MKMFKGFAAGLVIVLVLVSPACRSTKTKTTPAATTAATSTVPDVPTTVTTSQDTTVQTPPEDFIQDAQRPTVEELPRDVEQLNRLAQDRGYIRDAFFNYNESTLSEDAQMALNATAN